MVKAASKEGEVRFGDGMPPTGTLSETHQKWCSDCSGRKVFGARRTIHRAIIALEDAGFLLRDVLEARFCMSQRLEIV